MTTDLEGRLRATLHEDAQRARLVNPDRPPGPDIVSMSEIPRRARSGRRLVALAAAAAIVVVIAGVGITIRIEDPSRVATTAPTPTTAPPDEGCPFTAEEVSEVIGETVTGPESSTDCSFGHGFPSVYFDYLPASTCTQESLRDADGLEYSDAVDGLGVDAYSTPISLGMSLLVCNGGQPFAVLVDGVQGDDLAAAVALARLVLNG